jgi:glutathione S-transferase
LPYTRFAHQGGFDLGAYASLRRWISDTEKFLNLPPVR